mgnify:CR=1 FL=1
MRARGLLVAALVFALVLSAIIVSPGEIASTVVVLTLLALPLALSVAALLDAARRPEWVWALAGRARVVWMMLVLVGAIALPVGIVVSSWYLLRIRPELRDAENGRLRPR